MVIVNIGNGMGNQLFCYACGYAVARHDNDTLKLDTSDCDNSKIRKFELDNFNLDNFLRESFSNRTMWQKAYKRLRRIIIYKIIYEDQGGDFDNLRIFKKKKIRNKYLYGYWQDYRIFDLYKDDLMRQFNPSYELSPNVKKLIDDLSSNNTCAIHIRTGDITPLPLDYFKRAIDYIGSIKQGLKYIVFSNCINKTVDLLEGIENENIVMARELGGFSDIDEFFIMKACQNQIIANSTYSWWAAYLNDFYDKIVIAPDLGKCSNKMYPQDWKKILYNKN